MEKLESVSEILEFAIAREVDASEFYMEMAKRAEMATVRELFDELAGIELEHKAALELELMKEGIAVKTDARARSIELDNYMVVGDLRPGVERKDLLALAIEKEKISFRFYVDLVGLFREDEALKETLVSLAEEEARHVLRFQSKYEKEAAKEK